MRGNNCNISSNDLLFAICARVFFIFIVLCNCSYSIYTIKKYDNDLDIRVAFWIIVVVNLYVHLFTLIPLSLLCIDLLLSRKHWLCGIGRVCMLFAASRYVGECFEHTKRSFNYGASSLQMVFLTFPEFFNTIFLNILLYQE